jgi:UDP-glucose-4-epimerase GalE
VTELTLVLGGAGYIGSHTVKLLRERGEPVLVADNFSEGHRGAVGDAPCEALDLLDRDALRDLFARHRIGAVVHFAARAYVGESVQAPGVYYRNNVTGTLNLVDAMQAAGVRRIVFSSTCATYGEPERVPIVESEPQRPVNPYGFTKLCCEQILRDYARAHGFAAIALRYFNAAGADPDGTIGEDHDPETHLIPLVVAAALGRRESVTVFGDDYPTPDGTCIRDYVHVTDLAEAHRLALQALRDGATGFDAFNLGNQQGTSVLEAIRAVERVGGRKVPHRIGARRAGDPPVLVGSPAKIERQLGWRPRYGAIDTIVATAWRWHESHPHGYGRTR